MKVRELVLFVGTFLITWTISRSLAIGIGISSAAISVYLISNARANNKEEWELTQVLPEIIDHLISGVQSGLSLSEVLMNLQTRGPVLTQSFFVMFQERLMRGETFESAIASLQESFSIRSADQLFESLIFAKTLGGSDLLSLLRQLGDFTRQDLSLRREIQAKQGWVKNSAHLSAVAPWILLLLLSLQPATSKSFSSPQGGMILGVGVAMTVIAYLWMGKLSQMPVSKRVFGGLP